MNTKLSKLFACLVVLVLAAPLAQADEAEPQEMTAEEKQALYEEAVAHVEAQMTRASLLSFEDAVGAVVSHLRGETLDDATRFELALFANSIVDPETDSVDNAFVDAVMTELLQPEPAQGWGSDVFDQHSENMQDAYDAAAGVDPALAAELGEQDVRSTGSMVKSKFTSGGNGWTYFWYETTRDYLFGTAKDVNHNVDSIVTQFAVTHRIDAYQRSYIHWHCWGPWCFPHVHYYWEYVFSTPSRTVATDVTFEHAFPANAGQLATRAESSDGLMPIYDVIGHVTHQKAREETTAAPQDPPLPPEVPPLPPTPPLPPEVPAGRPGAGDLGAQVPAPNYYGKQTGDDEVPPTPPLPPAPPMPPEAPEVRERDGGSVERTGVTVGHTAERINSWESNLVIVRWNNAGTGTEGGTTTLAEQPASFFYEAASHFAGGGTVKAFDFAITADVSAV